jgi:hypothetical protein
LKRGIRFGGISAGEADFIIDKFWDEFLAVIRGRREDLRDADIEEQVRRVLDRVLGQAPERGFLGEGALSGPSIEAPSGGLEEPEELEELEAEPEAAAALEEAAALEDGAEAEGDLPYLYGPQWGLEDLAGEIELRLIHDGAAPEGGFLGEGALSGPSPAPEGERFPPGAGLIKAPSGPSGGPEDEGEDEGLFDSAPAEYPEELSGDYQGFHLYIPFSAEFPGPLELLEAAGGEAADVLDLEETEAGLPPGDVPDAVIEERDGIAYISEGILHSGRPVEGLDPDFQGLIDSIIANRYC